MRGRRLPISAESPSLKTSSEGNQTNPSRAVDITRQSKRKSAGAASANLSQQKSRKISKESAVSSSSKKTVSAGRDELKASTAELGHKQASLSRETNHVNPKGIPHDHNHSPVHIQESNGNNGNRNSSPNPVLVTEVFPTLTASSEAWGEVAITVRVGGAPYIPSSSGDGVGHDRLGQDGNHFYCSVCGEFGDIVCCDGCPRVFHRECLAEGTVARVSLDNDDDPWFCPYCNKKPKATITTTRRSDKADRRSSQHRCVDCKQVLPGVSLHPCAECGNYLHYPSCQRGKEIAHVGRVLCSTCRAVDALTGEEENSVEDAERSVQDPPSVDADAAAEEGEDDEAAFNKNRDESQKEREYAGKSSNPKERRRRRSSSLGDDGRRKKKRKKDRESSTVEQHDGNSLDSLIVDEAPSPSARLLPIAQATPAFHFYLGENRWKVERVLARKHRYFNRLPKGNERNELVAREAAAWWVKLRPTDHRRYMNMSMRDYERRIIEWKEDKNVREMMSAGSPGNDEPAEPETASRNSIHEHERLTNERHERLFRSTSVGSKPFKPEPDQSYNRVLLDLLHDMRFHPFPMFSLNRSETASASDDYASRVTIPFFEVQGPVSTSVGDECLGCTRGWTHYCPVLQRRVPAVEHRAKLQPPLSSLLATRVGLGLRPRLEKFKDPEEPRDMNDHTAGLFAWREGEEATEIKNLLVVPSCTIRDPNDRVDDIVQFIEETTAMKVPEPPRQSLENRIQTNQVHSSRTLPIRRPKDELVSSLIGDGFNKCGRCRAIIEGDTGCVQCRRAQLVINMSRRQPPGSANTKSAKGDGKSLKVHTAMLGRVHLKEGGSESQSPGDIAVGNGMLKERWAPCAILPPRTHQVPTPRRLKTPKRHNGRNDGVEKGETAEERNDDESDDDSQNDGNELFFQPRDLVDDYPACVLREARDVVPAADRQAALHRHKQESDEFNKKYVSIACHGILLGLMRRDPLKLFALPVTAEGYNAVVKNPIDLGKIRQNVLSGHYHTLGAFVSDTRLLCENALLYNPQNSIYWKAAEQLHEDLLTMQKRAEDWINWAMDAYASFIVRKEVKNAAARNSDDEEIEELSLGDQWEELRTQWPEAIEMLKNSHWLTRTIEADFMRTRENELAYYGCLAVRRAAAAAAVSLAPYTDSAGSYSVVSKRSHLDDEALRDLIDEAVSHRVDPVQLSEVSTWREESVVRLMRKVRTRRLEGQTISESGCSRCIVFNSDLKLAMNAEFSQFGKSKRKGENDVTRVDPSRLLLSTGLGSANTRKKIKQRQSSSLDEVYETVNDACVSVRESRIHGMGLFADQPFKKGDVVTEYIGEYISNHIGDIREKSYRERRIQDYQFRLDDKLVIDATRKGGPGRYSNHNCEPNCYTRIIPGRAPKEQLRRVMIIAQRDIEINEEITYDYQFPLELDLEARIPCNCLSDACRGFMNWDLPEKGSNNRALLVQKRGANMRDRIRRLGRPLKRDET